jgi:hypothetical protein
MTNAPKTIRLKPLILYLPRVAGAVVRRRMRGIIRGQLDTGDD